MTRDIHTLESIIKVFLYIAAILATSFPVLYLFSPWFTTKLGRLLMLQSVAFALALNVTVLFTFWQPADILVYFWIELIVFMLIAIACGCLTWGLWRTNHSRWSIHSSKQTE